MEKERTIRHMTYAARRPRVPPPRTTRRRRSAGGEGALRSSGRAYLEEEEDVRRTVARDQTASTDGRVHLQRAHLGEPHAGRLVRDRVPDGETADADVDRLVPAALPA